MKIRWKIFFIMWSMVMMMIGGFAITNTVYLEKFYIANKKDKLIQVGKVIADPNYIVDFRNLEIQNNAEITIKKIDQLERFVYKKQLIESDIEEIKESLKEEEPIFKTLNYEDYRGRVLVLFMPYRSDRYLEINTPLSLIQEGLELSIKYHVQIIILAFIIGSSMAFIFSKTMVTPILELKEITQKISKLDFSRKFEDMRKDEIGELGEAINLMGKTLEKNIDEINKANIKLTEDIEKEKKIDKLRKEFVACVSHELKTPIAIIQGYAQGLMENVANEEDRNFYCEVIIDESYKMDSLVKELLLISQIEAGYFKMNMEEVNIYELIKDLIEKYSTKTRKVNFSGEKNIFVMCDEKYIDRVLDNLIVNAIKYSSGEEDVEVKVEKIEKKCRITVINESEYLTVKDLETIWNPFVRLDSAIGKEGHGLGLAIVAGILENHKSQYGVYISEKNHVNFWFELNII
ncbi:HAMP domain-containing sensor histidine kinase [uncultured Fusobacterium sp.]|uniref:sensor histidine kinase n=1 Tax=uncultured Fusobacterium sp. TaxID=159267 RepID=UPI0025DA0C4F|nr:HAMP domain-containing sensor histidine kinase [uncultured Fusobacterium sp.]